MRIIPQNLTLILAAAGLSIVTGCVGTGGTDPDPTDGGIVGDSCEADIDCGDDEFCHAFTKECVPNCVTVTDSCTGETPVCNEDNGGVRPLEDDRFNNVCICSDTSCGADQICHPEYGVCVDSCTTGSCDDFDGDTQACYLFEDEGSAFCQSECAADTDCPSAAPFCDIASGQCLSGCNSTEDIKIECGADEACNDATGQCGDAGCTEAADCDANQDCDVVSGDCFDLCTTVGAIDDANCLAGEMCVYDGTCADPCDNDTCLLAQELCFSDTTNADFNNCVAPDLETANCASADEFANERGTDGPIIWDVEFYREATLDSDCDALNNNSSAYVLDFFYEDPDGDAFITNATAFDSFLFVEAGGTPLQSSSFIIFGDGATESAGDAGMTLCFVTPPANIAVQIEDGAGNLSNAGCADLATP